MAPGVGLASPGQSRLVGGSKEPEYQLAEEGEKGQEKDQAENDVEDSCLFPSDAGKQVICSTKRAFAYV